MNRRRFLQALAATPVAVALAPLARRRPMRLKDAFARAAIRYEGGPFNGEVASEWDFNGRYFLRAHVEAPEGIGRRGGEIGGYIRVTRYRLDLNDDYRWRATFVT